MAETDQARVIAERVARRLAAGSGSTERFGKKPDRIDAGSSESKPANSESRPRARVVDFITSGPPVAKAATIGSAPSVDLAFPETVQSAPALQSPWLRNFTLIDHPSQERFGIEEATVAELVEFFESEKKCSVEPGAKPCDHCSMCSSRGF